MIMLLPHEGLVEALSDLKDTWDFQCERAELGPPTPPSVEVMTGRIVQSVERPPLGIED
jgi:hypothetical protein